jgi:hypothetical protein
MMNPSSLRFRIGVAGFVSLMLLIGLLVLNIQMAHELRRFRERSIEIERLNVSTDGRLPPILGLEDQAGWNGVLMSDPERRNYIILSLGGENEVGMNWDIVVDGELVRSGSMSQHKSACP